LASRIRVRAYSSSANLGPGFDAIAVAHTAFYDEVELTVESGSGNVIVESVYGPYASDAGGAETARQAVLEALHLLGYTLDDHDIVLRVYKGIPPGRGLGSSGASAAAAVKALAEALELQADETILLEAAGRGEAAAAGAPHYDNAAASLLGGFTVVARDLEGRVYARSLSLEAHFVIYVPRTRHTAGKTRLMRQILPKTVSLEAASRNWSRLALLVAALALGDRELVGVMMGQDEIVEAARRKYIPCFSEAKRTALDAGALGVAISGAGPSLIALVDSEKNGVNVAKSLMEDCTCCEPDLVKVAKTAPGAERV